MISKLKETLATARAKSGTYSLSLCAVAIACVLVLNSAVSAMPAKFRTLDMTSGSLYDPSQTAADFMKSLGNDVRIIVLASDANIDKRIKNFLSNYENLSPRLHVEYIDPVAFPSATKTYSAEENSVVVLCEDTGKQRVISFYDIIKIDEATYYSTGEVQESEFDADGQLTSAVDYVTNESGVTIYTTKGHEEQSLPASVAAQLEKSNVKTAEVNLLIEGLPEDCAALLLYAPAVDLSADELAIVRDYLSGGGKVTLFLPDGSIPAEKLPNLCALLAEYGMTMADGYIADTDRYYQNSYYNIFPIVSTGHSMFEGLPDDAVVLLSGARGMLSGTPAREEITLSTMLRTSENGFAVTEDGKQVQNTYVLAASADELLESEKHARLTVIGAPSLIASDIIDRFANLSNLTIFTDVMLYGQDNVSNISIPAKSLALSYNTIPTANLWSLIFVGVIPLAVIGVGSYVCIRRRRA